MNETVKLVQLSSMTNNKVLKNMATVKYAKPLEKVQYNSMYAI